MCVHGNDDENAHGFYVVLAKFGPIRNVNLIWPLFSKTLASSVCFVKCEGCFRTPQQSRNPIPGRLENGGLGFVSTVL